MGRFLIVPPYRQWTLGATVNAADADSDHPPAQLCDGIPGLPLRLNSPNGDFDVSNPAGAAGIVAICHHRLAAGSLVTLGDDLSGTMTAPAMPRNGVALNFAELIEPESTVSSVSFAISGNTLEGLVGELVIGAPLELDPSLSIAAARFREESFVGERATPLAAHPGYSDHARGRSFAGSIYQSQTKLDALFEWFDSQDGYAYQVPTLVIPDDDDLTDVRLMTISKPQYTIKGPIGSETRYLVDLEFFDIPRMKW